MESEKNDQLIAEDSKNRLCKVTPLSKYLAMALFIAMPFIGGWIGYTYAPEKVVEVEKIVEVEKVFVTEERVVEHSIAIEKTFPCDRRIDTNLSDGWIQSVICNTEEPDRTFTISYPGDWSLHYSVFYDAEDKKVAEYANSVGLNTTCSEWSAEYKQQIDDIYSEEKIEIDDRTGLLIISGNLASGQSGATYWYPFSYCLDGGEKIFRTTFYSRDSIDLAPRELFEKILSTVQF